MRNASVRESKLGAYTEVGPRTILLEVTMDDYSYVVDKFWMVAGLLENGSVLLVTRTGKTRVVAADDPLLRKAGWWVRFRNGDRFPSPDVLPLNHAG